MGFPPLFAGLGRGTLAAGLLLLGVATVSGCSCIPDAIENADCEGFDLVFSGVPLLADDEDSVILSSSSRRISQNFGKPVSVQVSRIVKDEFNILPDIGHSVAIDTAGPSAACATELQPGVEYFFVLSTLGLRHIAVNRCDHHGPLLDNQLLPQLTKRCCPDSEDPIAKGDIDGDGVVDHQDVLILWSFVHENQGLVAEDMCLFEVANMDGDLKLDVYDLQMLEDHVYTLR